MRRWIAVGVLVLAGCASSTEPGADATAPPGTAAPLDGPALVVASGSDVTVMAAGGRQVFGTVEGTARVAYDTGAGVVVEVENDGTTSLVLLEADGTTAVPTPPGDAVSLFDVATIDGEPNVIFGAFREPDDDEASGEVFVQPLGGSDRTEIAPAFGPEFGVGRASFGGGVIVTSAVADLTEMFSFYDTSGTEVEGRPNPTDELGYNAPPFMSQAVLAPDGSTLAYLEGPDVDGANDPEKRVGDWELVVISQEDGEESLRLVVGAQAREGSWLDYDGRWAVVSFEDGISVIDTSADEPAALPAEGVTGIATILDGSLVG